MKDFLFLTLVLSVSTIQGFNSKRFLKHVKQVPIPDGVDVGEPLLLTPYLEANRSEEARNLSAVEYDKFLNVASYSGYFTVNKTYDSNLFFWYFPSTGSVKEDPVILWLQGGPGATSLFGLFAENGPFIIDKNQKLSLREYSWHKNHSLIYIDNPVGTGYSFTNGGYATNEEDVGEDLYSALLQFFILFPELQTNEFFITGESYAGKFIPAIGHTIQKYNPSAKQKINLKGVLIGNGWTDPINQLDYSEYLYQLGLVDISGRNQFNAVKDKTIKAIKNGNYLQGSILSDQMLDLVLNLSQIADIYNYIKVNFNETEPYEAFIQTTDFRKQLHVGNVTFDDDLVIQNIYNDTSMSAASWVAELLNDYKVLLYSGQLDTNVPYPTTLNYLEKLNFGVAEEYKNATRHIWKVDDEVAGYVKTAGNLTVCLVRNAGHMVPLDQPKNAYDLVYRFIRNINLY